MSSNRRDFLKNSLLGAGLLSTGLISCTGTAGNKTAAAGGGGAQHFNMSGYRAPKIDNVRVGFIGQGMRGPGAVQRFSHIEGVEIAAICDKYEDRVEKSQQILERQGLPRAKSYAGTEDAWKQLCEDPGIDLVYITSPWAYHTPMAVYAMENGKHAVTEIPAALTIEEAWQLVETSERTRKHCMMLENCCYDFFELMTLNMARQGYFGEIIHGEGAYIHDLLDLNFNKNGYADMWRLYENMKQGSLYPMHGLGPISQIMDINRGDKFEYLTSMQSNDFMMAKRAEELAAEDPFFKEFTGIDYRGNMNTTLIRTNKGRTIKVQHDVTSPRPYSRIHIVSGTKAFAQKWPSPERVARGHSWLNAEEMKALQEQFTPEIVRHVGEMARQIGGHGGMDFMMDWRLVDCLRNGLPLDMDVYDAALWSSVIPLSRESVNNRSNSVDIPDFTRGSWKSNAPVELTLKGGGTTGVKIKKTEKSEQ